MIKRLSVIGVLGFSIVIAIVVFALICVAPSIDFYGKSYVTPQNWIYVLVVLLSGAIAILGGKFLIASWSRIYQVIEKHPRLPYIVIGISGLLLFVVQLVVIHLGWFISGWDVGNITDIEHLDVYENYYAQYPNNFFLGGLLVRLHALATFFGLKPYVLFCAVGALGVTISIVEISIIAYEHISPAVSFVTFLVSSCLVGLHPWILVPYSDAYAMVFITTMLLLATRSKHLFARIVLCAFIAPLGYALKPTTIFMTLGVCVYLGYQIYAQSREGHGDAFGLVHRSKKVAVLSINVVLALALTAGGAGVSTLLVQKVKDFGLDPDFETYEMPFEHWLMMGLNDQTYGSYSADDLVYLWQFETLDERKQYAAESIGLRLNDLGTTGTAVLFGKKVLTAWNSGAFGWEPPGAYLKVRKDTNPALAWWYGYDSPIYEMPNHKNNIFELPAQLIWMYVLLGIASIFVVQIAGRRTHASEHVPYDFSHKAPLTLCAFALLFLTGYLMIFETSSRYIYLYAPEIVMLGMWGLWMALHTIMHASTKTKE